MDLRDRLRIDVPVAQAGMGGIAGGRLAAAVAKAGGLGTIGITSPQRLRAAIKRVREEAPKRAVAVNLLMPFVRRAHVRVCLDGRIDVAVIAFGGDPELVWRLRTAGVFVMVMVGTQAQARTAVAWGADGLIAQGREAGGHLTGTTAALTFLSQALVIARRRPVLLAGGIATSEDTQAALAAGASGVVAGTRFLLTSESEAHPAYQSRLLTARKTLETRLFGLGWPVPHRVAPNAATERWHRADGSTRGLPRAVNAMSGALARLPLDDTQQTALRLQRPGLPLFTPTPLLAGMPEEWADRAALYAGESALRIDSVIPAAQAVADLAG